MAGTCRRCPGSGRGVSLRWRGSGPGTWAPVQRHRRLAGTTPSLSPRPEAAVGLPGGAAGRPDGSVSRFRRGRPLSRGAEGRRRRNLRSAGFASPALGPAGGAPRLVCGQARAGFGWRVSWAASPPPLCPRRVPYGRAPSPPPRVWPGRVPAPARLRPGRAGPRAEAQAGRGHVCGPFSSAGARRLRSPAGRPGVRTALCRACGGAVRSLARRKGGAVGILAPLASRRLRWVRLGPLLVCCAAPGRGVGAADVPPTPGSLNEASVQLV